MIDAKSLLQKGTAAISAGNVHQLPDSSLKKAQSAAAASMKKKAWKRMTNALVMMVCNGK